MSTDLYKLSATEIVQAVKEKRIKVSEIMESCIDRITAIEEKVHAWEYFDPQLAFEKAKKMDLRILKGENAGTISGVPIGVKDIIDTKDMPTCMGSPIWKDFTPGHNARIVDRLIWEGGVITGKTVTSEFGVHYPGPTLNPHNPEHTSGTSSSGSAVAVATRMVPVAIGTQTLGSLIRPASYNGVYAFKPTFGIIPRTGVLKTTDSLDQIGFFCHSVEDVGIVFKAAAHVGPNYPYTEKLNEVVKMKIPYRVALLKAPSCSEAKGYAKEAINSFSEELDKLSEIIVEQIDLPNDFDIAWDTHKVIYEKCLSYYFKEEFARYPDNMSDIMKNMIIAGQKVTRDEYIINLKRQSILSQKLDQFFGNYDFLLTLSTSGEAPEGEHTMNDRDNILIWTMCGVPIINIPLFVGPKGLPFGIQLIAKRYDDLSLINAVNLLKTQGLIPEGSNPIVTY